MAMRCRLRRLLCRPYKGNGVPKKLVINKKLRKADKKWIKKLAKKWKIKVVEKK